MSDFDEKQKRRIRRRRRNAIKWQRFISSVILRYLNEINERKMKKKEE